jgi:hypothetical protein
MGEEEMNSAATPCHLGPELPDPRARVEHELRPVASCHLDARGVSSEALRPVPRDWDRAAHAPEPDAHHPDPSMLSRATQKNTIAP